MYWYVTEEILSLSYFFTPLSLPHSLFLILSFSLSLLLSRSGGCIIIFFFCFLGVAPKSFFIFYFEHRFNDNKWILLTIIIINNII